MKRDGRMINDCFRETCLVGSWGLMSDEACLNYLLCSLPSRSTFFPNNFSSVMQERPSRTSLPLLALQIFSIYTEGELRCITG